MKLFFVQNVSYSNITYTLFICTLILILFYYQIHGIPELNDFARIFKSSAPQYKHPGCGNVTVNYSRISKQEILKRLQFNPRSICGCKNLSTIPTNLKATFVESTCSDEVTLLGLNQQVLTFSLYTEKKNPINYFEGISVNLQRLNDFYPGWVIRVYTDFPYDGTTCRVVCMSKDVYFCDAKRLPTFGNVAKMNKRTWRFLTLGDPTVKQFASRDLDSVINQREKDAVLQWELSGYPIHAMRDHPQHTNPVLAGMWGADNFKLCPVLAQEIQKELIRQATKTKENDEKILEDVIFKKHQSKILRHDSYNCGKYNGNVPFPTQRQNQYDFIGNVHLNLSSFWQFKLISKCPANCRPSYGKTWEYC